VLGQNIREFKRCGKPEMNFVTFYDMSSQEISSKVIQDKEFKKENQKLFWINQEEINSYVNNKNSSPSLVSSLILYQQHLAK
jgi:hypothetical protein